MAQIISAADHQAALRPRQAHQEHADPPTIGQVLDEHPELWDGLPVGLRQTLVDLVRRKTTTATARVPPPAGVSGRVR